MVKISKVFIVIKSITDDKGIGNSETNIVGDIAIGSVGLLDEKTGNLDGRRLILSKLFQKLDHGGTGIDDILDNQEVLRGGNTVQRAGLLTINTHHSAFFNLPCP
jgi:hypothetical protein